MSRRRGREEVIAALEALAATAETRSISDQDEDCRLHEKWALQRAVSTLRIKFDLLACGCRGVQWCDVCVTARVMHGVELELANRRALTP